MISLIIILILAGFFKALQDNEVRKGRVNKTWKNKWALQGMQVTIKYKPVWYYFGIYKPAFKERFPFSSTILVWVTDKWHLYGGLKDSLLIIAISIGLHNYTIETLYTFLGLKALMLITFNLKFKLK